jgi:serine protease
MRKFMQSLSVLAIGVIFGLGLAGVTAASPERNPVRTHPVHIGPQADRLVVGFRATIDNAVIKMIQRRSHTQPIKITQAQTSAVDVNNLARRTGIVVAASRQTTPSTHVLFLAKTLYGADVAATLELLRSDPSVAFAEVDERRYPHALPNDPLFLPSDGATGQWYMQTPSPAGDASATDAVSAWGLTMGSSGTVIADVDSGVRFDHPDLLRAGFGGRLLPGYDFVGDDLNRSNGTDLGTFLMANDGDGWDPDPTDPGDFVSAADLMNPVFPPADCGDSSTPPGPVDSTWHGTRVVGVMGAITNNAAGVAGMTWNPYILPVRALGKCGGFDSDIMVGMQWAAGMSVTGVPDNPFPADIINLSLGGSSGTTCPASYENLVQTLSEMGVLVVASAGNESGPVDVPGNCAGVLAVAGLRNVGTKVGYSSFGAEVGISAPAGNCVNTSGPCLRSIDTTTNAGLTTPGANTYTNQTNENLGTSFSAPIVSGIAALMRAVNGNLKPAQLIARIQSSASPFPQPAGLPQCPALATDGSEECACVPGQCGAGMINALSAVNAALNPIAAISFPANFNKANAVLNGGGSVAACGATIASYAWSATGLVHVASGASSPQATVTSTGAGTLTLTVTDSVGKFDTATVMYTASGATTSAPSSGGAGADACVASMTVAPTAPTVAVAFEPGSIAPNAATTLTITLSNANGFALTQSSLAETLPANLNVATDPGPTTTCGGAAVAVTSASSTTSTGTITSFSLTNAVIPADGSCQIMVPLSSATAGNYAVAVAANDLMTAPAGGNAVTASQSLAVGQAGGTTGAAGNTSGGGGGGGGELDWLDVMFVIGLVLACRRPLGRRTRP